jgi:hypothetical protein
VIEPRFCKKCGKHLVVERVTSRSGFDPYTGEEVVHHSTDLVCSEVRHLHPYWTLGYDRWLPLPAAVRIVPVGPK